MQEVDAQVRGGGANARAYFESYSCERWWMLLQFN